MPPKKNPLKLNPLQLKTLALFQEMARNPELSSQHHDTVKCPWHRLQFNSVRFKRVSAVL